MNRETVKERIAEVRMSDPESLRRTLRSAPRSAQDTRGVIFRREYRGRIYEMRSLGNGRYEYDQKIYTSANAIAASPHRNGGGLTLKSPPYM